MSNSTLTGVAIPTQVGMARLRIKEKLIETLLFLCGLLSILTTLGIVLVLAIEAASFFSEVSIVDFLTDTEWTPLFINKHFGILPLACGTLLVSLVALSVSVPMGLVIAIYLSEFASPRVRGVLKPILEVLAGVPTVVYGYFALLFVTPLLQSIFPEMNGFNALSPGIVMGIMILPMVTSLSEDAIHGVPKDIRAGAYALGASKLQVTFGVLVPAALGGVIASIILAMSRAVGETMIVTIAAGQQPSLTMNVLEPVETMTAFIVQVSLGDTPHGTLEYKTIFAVGSALFLLTLFLNGLSLWFKERFQQVEAR